MPNQKPKNSNKAFTLIELLVVIAIIGLLASIALVATQSARAKARDAKRIADINQLSKALELYAADHGGKYPITHDAYSTDLAGTCPGPVVAGGPSVPAQAGCGWCNRWCWLSSALSPYLDEMPKDPRNTGNYYYYYQNAYNSNYESYGVMAYVLEDSGNRQKYSNPNGSHISAFELGSTVQYCLDKYTGIDADWRYNSNYTRCKGGN